MYHLISSPLLYLSLVILGCLFFLNSWVDRYKYSQVQLFPFVSLVHLPESRSLIALVFPLLPKHLARLSQTTIAFSNSSLVQSAWCWLYWLLLSGGTLLLHSKRKSFRVSNSQTTCPWKRAHFWWIESLNPEKTRTLQFPWDWAPASPSSLLLSYTCISNSGR